MPRSCYIWMAALLLMAEMVAGLPCRAQKTPAARKPAMSALLNKGIRATAFVYDTEDTPRVMVQQDGRPAFGMERSQITGSAFCISEQGYYITNEHVVSRCPEKSSVRMSLWVGPGYCWDVDALVVRKDKERDLALLKVVKRDGIYAFPLGADIGPTRGAAVTVFGFPGGFSKSRSPFPEGMRHPDVPQTPPNVTVSTGQVTNLYGEHSVLKAIEADAKVAGGNSGGPLVDSQGRLIGVVAARSRKTGRCLAIAVRTLKQFLARPEVALEIDPPTIKVEPTTIPVGERARERSFTVKLAHRNGEPYVFHSDVSVWLHLSVPGMASPVLETRPAGKGVFTIQAVPVPPAVEGHYVTLAARSKDRVTFYYRVKDQPVQVGEQTLSLSRLAHIAGGDNPAVTLADGTRQAIRATGLEHLELPPREDTPDVSLDAAQSISILNLPVLPQALAFHAGVTAGGRIMTEQSGQIPLAGVPARPRRTGMVIACADEWPTNNAGEDGHAPGLTPSVRQYIRNIANLFTSGAPGNLLICTEHWTFGPAFVETLQEAGHAVTTTLKPGKLDGYDAVFIGGHEIPTEALVQYVRQGGRVYVAGGCGGNDGALCNGFLNAFGLAMGTDGRSDEWRVEPNAALPLFAGVKELKMVGVSPLTKLPGNWPNTYVTMPQFGVHLWGIYAPDSDITAPLRALP